MRDKGRTCASRLTLVGRVALSRRRWARGDSSTVTPADAWIDAAGRTVSLGVRELACRLATDTHSFRRAARNLEAAAGLSMSAETLRQVVEAEGKLVIQAQTHEQLELDWEARGCLTASPGRQGKVSRVYVSCDGVQVPMVTAAEKRERRAKALRRREQIKRARAAEGEPATAGKRRLRPLPRMKPGADQRYKEMRLVTLYDQARTRRALGVTRHDHRHAGRLMRRMSGAVKLREAQEKVAIIDGAPWIETQLRRNVPCLDALTLDFYHLSQHVHQARVAVFGESDAAGRAWAEDLLHTIRHEGYEPWWGKLAELRGRTRAPRKREALDALMHYGAQRREMLDYPRHADRAWDIGSGPMESMCKATTRRSKGPGMRWDAENAEAMMALECLEQSGRWHRWWGKRAASMN